jgi:HK97 family phage prohead protease
MANHRAYSLLQVKAVEEVDEDRVIRGIATTPEIDRVGDIIDPLGVKFQNPLPLLWQHRHDSPVGTVKFSKATKDGIEFEAKLPKIQEEGELKRMIDMAWQAVKAKLVRGVSIGFRAIEYSFIEGGGIRFSETEVFELSLVTIPANAGALITSAKSLIPFDDSSAASGTRAARLKSPGVSGGSVRIIKPEDTTMAKKTYAEQITDLEGTREAKMKRLNEITEKTLEDGVTKDAAQREEFNTLKSEIESLDTEIDDLRAMEKMAARTARPVDDEVRRKANATASPSTDAPRGHVQVKNTQKLDPGIRVARLAKCMTIAAVEQASGRFMTADQVAKSLYQGDEILNAMFQKAAVAAATTASGNWGEDLVGDETGTFADFVEFLRPQTILGRFGSDGIPSLRRVPFRVPLVGQTVGGSGYWVGEGNAKPLTALDFARTTLTPLKVANIAVASMEVLRDSSPSAEMLIRDGLVSALRERLDIDFIDPAKTASAGISPASITNGAPSVASSRSGSRNSLDWECAAEISSAFRSSSPNTCLRTRRERWSR